MDLAWNDYVTIFLLLFGCFFALTGGIGIIRMPDFYTRIHPAGKSDTLGQFLILTGLAFQLIETEPELDWSYTYSTDPWMCLVRLVLIIMIILFTAPTATHAITKAAQLEGLEPWVAPEEKEEADEEASDAVNSEDDGAQEDSGEESND